MNKYMKACSAGLFGLLAGFVVVGPANSAPILIDLGEWGPSSVANDGTVVGFGLVSGEVRALSYKSGVMQDVSPRSGYATGVASNNDGIVGSYFDSEVGQYRGYIRSPDGSYVSLGMLGGHWSTPIQASGDYITGAAFSQAFRYSKQDGLLAIPTGSTSSLGLGVNALGDVVGQRQVSAGIPVYEAFFANGVDLAVTSLSGLGGSESIAWAINDSGYIVGSSATGAPNTKHAVTWKNGILFDLGVGNGVSAELYDVNNSGLAVGYTSADGAGEITAIIAGLSGGLVPLESLLLDMGQFDRLFAAQGINDRGDIVGTGRLHDGSYHGFLITGISIPEPNTLNLLIAGLLVYVSAMRLNKQRIFQRRSLKP